jgi:hypothetical protein
MVLIRWQRLPVTGSRRHVRKKPKVRGTTYGRFAHKADRLTRVATFDQRNISCVGFDSIGYLVQDFLALFTGTIAPVSERVFGCPASSIYIFAIAGRYLPHYAVVDWRNIFESLPRAASIALAVYKMRQRLDGKSLKQFCGVTQVLIKFRRH